MSKTKLVIEYPGVVFETKVIAPTITNVGEVPTQTKTVVVVGVPKGGTSVTAITLDMLGIPIATRDHEKHTSFYENQKFMVANLETNLAEIKRLDSLHAVWGFKNPSGVHVSKRLSPHLRNPHYVFVTRDVVAVAESVAYQRNKQKLSDSLISECSTQNQDLLKYYVTVDAPKLLVSYERIQKFPAVFVFSLLRFLQVDCSDEMVVSAINHISPIGGYIHFDGAKLRIRDEED